MAASIDVAAIRAELDELLRSNDPPRTVLLELIRRLDGLLVTALEERDEPARLLVKVALARATYATRPLLGAEPDAQLDRTAAAARAYAASPSEETDRELSEAATQSYPFGPGDGCHGLRELGGHEARDGGCASGAGFLANPAHVAGDEAVLAAIRAAGLW